MSTWRNPGLWLNIGIVGILGIWPLLSGRAAQRETVYNILMYICLATSLNIILGYTGYVSFGHVVFFGLGGYFALYCIGKLHASLWLALLVAGLAAGLLAFLLGKAILRLRGAYFGLATIGINEAVRAFVNNFPPFGGATGISLNFSVYQAFGGAARALWLAYGLLFGLTLFGVVLSYWIKTSKFGLGLTAIREDEDAAEVMGVNTAQYKTWAFVLSAILPGIIGALYFFKNGNIEPEEAFRLDNSIQTIVMVMLGGQGTVLGPILGAFGYQRLRGFFLTAPMFKNIQLAASGVILLLIVLFIPSGAVGWVRKHFPRLRKVLV
jgi:branched-chain amino acid transport system permease protein